jgi:hypothetical protein
MSNTDFYTVTMAKIYSDQGYFGKAAEIYRYLISKEPDRIELKDALVEIEAKMIKNHAGKRDRLVGLFREWLKLINNLRDLKRLNRLQRMIRDLHHEEDD